jgi:hypothetical protein
MLALSLGIIFGRTIERWMSGAQEFPDVARQKLHLLGDSPERIYMHRILGSLLNDVAYDIGGDLNGSTPRRISSRAGMQRGAVYPRRTPTNGQLSTQSARRRRCQVRPRPHCLSSHGAAHHRGPRTEHHRGRLHTRIYGERGESRAVSESRTMTAFAEYI